MTDDVLYLFSESGDFVFKTDNSVKTALYNVDRGAYVVLLDGNAYHNEKINIYTDEEKTNMIGSITVKYGINDYEVGGQTYSSPSRSRSLFSTGIFGTTSKSVSKNDEPIQITKSEYAKLVSKINQLTEIINKLK